MSDRLRIERVDYTAMPGHAEAWHDLATRCLEPCVFTEPAFAMAAARHLAPAPGPMFVLIWEEATVPPPRLLGLCMLTRRGANPLLKRAFAHPQATAAFPMLDRAAAAPALSALLGAVAGLPGGPAGVLFEGLDAAGPTARLIALSGTQAHIFDQRSRAVLRNESPATGLSSKARKELRRKAHRLADAGAVTFSSATGPADVRTALAGFLRLEAAGWKGRRGTGLGQTPSLRAFAEAAVEGLAAAGQCRIDSLTLDRMPIAIGIVLRSGDHAWFWKIAFDEALGAVSPGVQLARRLGEVQQSDRTLVLTDSCAMPGHSMIDRLWRDRITVCDILVATAAGASMPFRAAVTLETARRAARWWLKRAYSFSTRRKRLRN